MKKYICLGILHTSAKCDFPIAGIKCHNQGNKWKEVFIGLTISKRDSITIGGGGMAAGSWKRKPKNHF